MGVKQIVAYLVEPLKDNVKQYVLFILLLLFVVSAVVREIVQLETAMSKSPGQSI